MLKSGKQRLNSTTDMAVMKKVEEMEAMSVAVYLREAQAELRLVSASSRRLQLNRFILPTKVVISRKLVTFFFVSTNCCFKGLYTV